MVAFVSYGWKLYIWTKIIVKIEILSETPVAQSGLILFGVWTR